MIFENKFNNENIQIDEYKFKVMGAESITLEILKAPFEHCLVFLKNPDKKIKMIISFKTRKKTYTLSEDFDLSDNCTLNSKIDNGEWTLEILKTYKIEGEYSISVSFNNQLTKSNNKFNPLKFPKNKIIDESSKWYVGDLHMHSFYTDGRVSHEEIKKDAENSKLDFIAVSDHSIFTSKFPNSNILIIPSTEITLDNMGHYNIHGLTDFINYLDYFKNNDMDKNSALDNIFKDLKNYNCLTCINHPFVYSWDIKHDFNIENIDLIEVINAPHLLDEEIDNEKAIRFFDYLWSKHICIMGVGGSDAHKKNYFQEYPIALPKTSIYCNGLSIYNLLESLKKGNSFISLYDDFEILFIDIKNNVILPGDKFSGDMELNARCKNIVIWQLIKNGEKIFEIKSKKFCYKIKILENDYFRLQARNLENEIILFVNPVHNISTPKKNIYLQNILKDFSLND